MDCPKSLKLCYDGWVLKVPGQWMKPNNAILLYSLSSPSSGTTGMNHILHPIFEVTRTFRGIRPDKALNSCWLYTAKARHLWMPIHPQILQTDYLLLTDSKLHLLLSAGQRINLSHFLSFYYKPVFHAVLFIGCSSCLTNCIYSLADSLPSSSL